MITVELLNQNETLKNLTEEQKNTIATLSLNDENVVIAAKTREHYDGIDKDVLEASGIAKEQREKTYDYLKRAFGVVKNRAGDLEVLKTEISDLKSKNADLQAKIKEGGGAAFQQQIRDKDDQISRLESQINTSKIDYEGKLAEKEAANLNLQIGFRFDQALVGKKFKSGIPQSAIDATLKAAKMNVLAKGTPEFQEDAEGNKIVVFRDRNERIIPNPENLQKPFTAKELYLKELADILDQGQNRKGAGTKPGEGGTATTIAIGEARTKTEAVTIIKQSLASQGIVATSPDYQDKFNEAYKANKVSELPLR